MEDTDAPLKFEELDPLEQDEVIDLLLTEAQDAYFFGDIEKAISTSKQVLEFKPREQGAYQLLALSYPQVVSPDLVVQLALDWGKMCGETPSQLNTLVKYSYLAEDLANLVEGAKKIANNTEYDNALDKALSAAFAGDLGDISLALTLASTCAVKEDLSTISDEMELADMVRVKVLLGWVKMKQDSKQGFLVLDQIIKNTKSDTLGIGLVYALKAIQLLEDGKLEEAEASIKQAEVEGLTSCENVLGAKMLVSAALSSKKGEKVSEDVIQLGLDASRSCNYLIKRRLDKKFNLKQ